MAVIDCLEVVNYLAWWPASTGAQHHAALGLRTSMLNAGHRITGRSDVFHLAPDARYADSPYPEAIRSGDVRLRGKRFRCGHHGRVAARQRLPDHGTYSVVRRRRSGSRRCGMGEHIDAHSGQLTCLWSWTMCSQAAVWSS